MLRSPVPAHSCLDRNRMRANDWRGSSLRPHPFLMMRLEVAYASSVASLPVRHTERGDIVQQAVLRFRQEVAGNPSALVGWNGGIPPLARWWPHYRRYTPVGATSAWQPGWRSVRVLNMTRYGRLLAPRSGRAKASQCPE